IALVTHVPSSSILDNNSSTCPHPPSYDFYPCNSSDDPRHQHSFPTRRSSDLHVLDPALAEDPGALEAAQVLEAVGDDEVGVLERSEEHTSELQSLRHLVCRLLLEKKKEVDMYELQCLSHVLCLPFRGISGECA